MPSHECGSKAKRCSPYLLVGPSRETSRTLLMSGIGTSATSGISYHWSAFGSIPDVLRDSPKFVRISLMAHEVSLLAFLISLFLRWCSERRAEPSLRSTGLAARLEVGRFHSATAGVP